jgi:hypothetical protein
MAFFSSSVVIEVQFDLLVAWEDHKEYMVKHDKTA